MPTKLLTLSLRALLFSTLLLSTWANAQSNKNEWFQVEVLLFSYPHNQQQTTAIPRESFTTSYPVNLIRLRATKDQAPAASDPEQATNITNANTAYLLLPNNARLLAQAAQRIKGSADVRLLAHLAWRQPVNSNPRTQPVLLQSGDQFGSAFELEGTLSINQNRFLQANFALALSRFQAAAVNPAMDGSVLSPANSAYDTIAGNEISRNETPGNKSAADNTTTIEANDGRRYHRALTARLNHSRRILPGELHYIDHPLFGIILQITPYQAPALAAQSKYLPIGKLPTFRTLSADTGSQTGL